MSSINMIAARRAEKQNLEKRVRIMFVVVAFELVVTLGLFSFMTAKTYSANKNIDRLSNEIERIQPTVDEIRQYEIEIAKLEPKLDLLADSREATLLWSTIMEDMSHAMPPKTWLYSMNTVKRVCAPGNDPENQPAPKVVVNLRGTSDSQRLVGDTMLRLAGFPEFERIDLNYTQRSGNSTLETVDFDIAAIVKSDEPEEVKEARDES